MAAASRAFEDEWERQSNASASVAAPSIAPTQAYSAYSPVSPPPIPQQQQPYGMPMVYGFPGHQHQQMPPMPHMPQGYMYPSYPAMPGMPGMSPLQHPYGHALPPQPEPSIYAYGAGAQSVYGAEFGPSQAHMNMHHTSHAHGSNGQAMSPYARPMSMSFPQSYSTTNLHQPYENHTQHHSRPSLPTSKSTSYFSQSQSQSQSHSQPHSHQHSQQQQQHMHHRQLSRESSRRDRSGDDLDYTPPPTRGSGQSTTSNSPRGANRRSQLGTSVISANDRTSTMGPPPTSWRRSSAMPLLAFDEEEGTPKKKRSSVIIN